MSASGRVCEITNGRFVEAKHEKRWLAVRLLRSKPAGRFGREAPVRPSGQRSLDRRIFRMVSHEDLDDRRALQGGRSR